MKMRVASGGIRTHDTLYSGQMLYQLRYQGSSAGRVRIKHLICLYEQANLTCTCIHCALAVSTWNILEHIQTCKIDHMFRLYKYTHGHVMYEMFYHSLSINIHIINTCRSGIFNLLSSCIDLTLVVCVK